jgi:serine protease Do
MARGLNGSANGAGHWPPPGQEGVVARTPGDGSGLPAAVVAALPAVVGVKTSIPENRRSAQTLGTEREGHGILLD